MKKKSKTIKIIVIWLTIILCLYYIFLAPIFSVYILGYWSRSGVEYYTKNSMRRFREVRVLQEYIAEREQGEITGFYHINNRMHFNPIYYLYYGTCDTNFCAVDMQYDRKTYESIKAEVIEVGTVDLMLETDPEFSLFTVMNDAPKTVIAIGFHDEYQIVRYLCATSCYFDPYDKYDFNSSLAWNAGDLSWHIDEETLSARATVDRPQWAYTSGDQSPP